MLNRKGISLYPNPAVKGSDVQVKFTNSKAGKYEIVLYSLTGVRVMQTNISHPGGQSLQKANLPGELSSGTYIVEIISPEGESGKTKLIVQ